MKAAPTIPTTTAGAGARTDETPPSSETKEQVKEEPSSEVAAPPPGTVERPPEKNWSCSQCKETDRSGLFWTTPNEEADGAVWSLTVRTNADKRSIALGPDATAVQLPDTSSWSCVVGAHWYRVIYFRSDFGIPLWFREILCTDSAADKTILLSQFDCNGRGVDTNSDELSLWTDEDVVHVEMRCTMSRALKESDDSLSNRSTPEAEE